ncbi:hypothetical protein IWQ61_000527 [Dispira simplex]|nr:hypothetical protein IWQ61_000527 [Dispira simplex]
MKFEPWKPVVDALRAALSHSEPTETEMQAVVTQLACLRDLLQAHPNDPDNASIRSYTLMNVDLPSFFVLLGSNQPTLVERTVKVIRLLLLPLTYTALDQDYREYIFQGLQAGNPETVLLGIRELSKYDPSSDPTFGPYYLPWLLKLLESDQGEVVRASHQLLVRVCQQPANLENFVTTDNQEIMAALMKSSTVCFRIYDLFVDIALQSDAQFERCRAETVIFRDLGQEATSDDLLRRLSALEVYFKLCETTYGYAFLQGLGIFPAYTELLADPEPRLETILVQCSAVQFFARLIDYDHVDFTQLEASLGLFDLMETLLTTSPTQDVKNAVVIALGILGLRNRGLILLNDHNKLLAHFVDEYNHSDHQYALVCLQTLAKIFEPRDPITEKICHITSKVYGRLRATQAIKRWVTLAKMDMDDISPACLQVLEGMAVYEWGRKIMQRTYEFMTYLLDRNSNRNYINKKWKYSLVKILHEKDQEAASPVFENNVHQLLDKYVKEGPFYVTREAAVMLESQ